MEEVVGLATVMHMEVVVKKLLDLKTIVTTIVMETKVALPATGKAKTCLPLPAADCIVWVAVTS